MDNALERDRLREFIDIILGSLDEDLDGATIASRGYLSRYHFDRLVSAALGESPGAFRRRLLLERAAWQLQGCRTTILRVALGSGYRSVEGFSRAFARAFDTTPARFRASGKGFRLDAPNGIHFHPPGGLTVPGSNERSKRVDFVDRIVGHDIWFTRRLLDRAGELPSEALDQTVLRGATLFAKDGTTLRALLNEMVATKENWSATLAGLAAPHNGGDSLDDLQRRYHVASEEFSRLVHAIRDRGQWDEGFIDALCDPPESFTYGGMLAHVATFSAWRRTLTVLAFRQLGVDDVGIGDPIEWERSLA